MSAISFPALRWGCGRTHMNKLKLAPPLLASFLLAACEQGRPPCEITLLLKTDAFERMVARYSEMGIIKRADYGRMMCAYEKWHSQFWSWYRLGCKIEFDELTMLHIKKSIRGAFDLEKCRIVSDDYYQDVI